MLDWAICFFRAIRKTLSGGEAQRVKLATELSKKGTGKTLLYFR